MPDLHDWAVVPPSPYVAPELAAFVLRGATVAGRKIQTSAVVEVVSDRVCVTRSGTRYRLVGAPLTAHRGSVSTPLGEAARLLAMQRDLGRRQS